MTTDTETAPPDGTRAICDKALLLACKAMDAGEFDAMRAIARELRQVADEIQVIADVNEQKR